MSEKTKYPEPLAKGAIFIEFHEDRDEATISIASLLTPNEEGGRWRPVDRFQLEAGDEASDAFLGGLMRRLMRRLAKDVLRKSPSRLRLEHAVLRDRKALDAG